MFHLFLVHKYIKEFQPIEISSLNIPILRRGNTSVDGRGIGVERPAELTKEDDEYDAYRKRMMLAYRFRPNPLVRLTFIKTIILSDSH